MLLAVLPCVIILYSTMPVCVPVDTIEAEMPDSGLVKNQDVILQASATILALTIFGSILGVRISVKRKAATWQGLWIFLISVHAIIIVVVQALTILDACCGELRVETYGIYVWATALSLIGIIISSGMVVKELVHEARTDDVNENAVGGGPHDGGGGKP